MSSRRDAEPHVDLQDGDRELRCSIKRYGIVREGNPFLDDPVIEIHCRHHSERGKRNVFHRWHALTYEKLEDRIELI